MQKNCNKKKVFIFFPMKREKPKVFKLQFVTQSLWGRVERFVVSLIDKLNYTVASEDRQINKN